MLSRRSLAVVLQSLLTAELQVARGRGNPGARVPSGLPDCWPETLRIGDSTADGLGCDSLERLWLAAAVNEMFHLHEADGADDLLTATTFGSWMDRVEGAWRLGVDAVTFTTSGSTGQPKRCVHAATSLLVEAAFLAELFQDRQRVVSLVPAHHAYGFIFAVLLPDALGVAHLDASRLGPGELARCLAGGDLVVTFPDRWRWLERSLPGWPEDVEGVVSTAPCPPELIRSLCDNGLAGMTEVYGSSETAGVAVRRWPAASYHLMPHWRFVEPVSEDAPVVVDQSGRNIGLPDRIRLAEANHFKLVGRRDGMVQVGGVNVDPGRVAALLRRRPGVRDAAVRLMRPDEGARLKAFVVPELGTSPSALRGALEAWIDAELPAAERPMAIGFGLALPTTTMGKTADW